eukprot:TRINITY_DN8917_c1_g1_i1.p1 TRINITY_DN8917_c1_g1~~TRINITY_DN8917_c1_g1_i1.p1  ORF type:complete len:418 (+),score=33.53 TRINITY_DN8917_c1_g1_i1:81-1256(+)
MEVKELSTAETLEDRLGILSEVAAATCSGVSLQKDRSSPVEVFLSRGKLVAMSRRWETLFELPLMFTLIGCHRHGFDSVQENLPGLAGVISCTCMSTSTMLSWEKERDSRFIADAFTSSEVWLLVVTPFDVDDLPVGSSRTLDAAFADAVTALGELGAICCGVGGIPFSQSEWEKSCSGAGATAAVTLLREFPKPLGDELEEERLSSAVKCWKASTPDVNVLRETRSLLRVQTHPNICRFIGLFRSVTWSGVPQWLMCMEAHSRGDLARIMRQSGAFPEVEALSITEGVLEALAHIHASGVIHRDVKLGNVVLSVAGTPVLVDFGLAVHVSEKHDLKRQCGSPGSVAPEILLGRGCCNRSDIFSCGTVLYGTLSATVPSIRGRGRKGDEWG